MIVHTLIPLNVLTYRVNIANADLALERSDIEQALTILRAITPEDR